ncbi:MAG: amidohydrolase family protein [bacterium]|nr:amidohydrolase family protein [bacterium]
MTDAHAHIFSDDQQRYPVLASAGARPPGIGTVPHLQQQMAAAGVHRVVAIHTSLTYGFDNRFLIDSARANAPWMAGVCTLHPEDPKSPDLLRTLVRDCNVRGMRSVPAGQPERHLDYTVEKHLNHPGVDALWNTAEDLGIVINVLIKLALADELEIMLQKHPNLPVVLDHCMFVHGDDGMQGETMQKTLHLARYPNLHAKLTWLVAGSGQPHPFPDTPPLLRAVIDAYGPERCVWGSDFPCEQYTPKVSYTQYPALFRECLDLSDAESEAILSTTPGRLYFGDAAGSTI